MPRGPRSAPAARKRFGQHFLADEAVVDRLVRIINPQPGDRLVEIGPGRGALTGPLLERCESLTAIELDRDLVPLLREEFSAHRGFSVIEADALSVDFGALAEQGAPLRIVGNLPYNISTPLLFHLMGFAERIRDMHFMLQREVVNRICARPGSHDYGRLTVSLAAHAEADSLFGVGPESFRPAPRVDSAVVRLVPRPPAFSIVSPEAFERVVREAFNHRRKTLGNALKGLCDAGTFDRAGIDPARRPETLAPAEFAALANALY